MPNDRHLIRMAGRIQRQLSRPAMALHPELGSTVTELINWLECMQRDWRLVQHAVGQGWDAAAAAKERDVLSDVTRIESAACRLIAVPRRPPASSNPPSLRTIHAELRQLETEFEDVEIDLKQGLIGVTTDRIVLEGIDLGPFSIELHLDRLADRLDSGCFECIALEPNPAGSNEGITHPHVQDDHLCAGDASLPIQAALKEGRIADAFFLIRSVLQTYNSDSPYVSLDNWSGTRCEDCDYLADSDQMYFCDGCERDVCEDCYSCCDICNEGCCHSCLERDTVSDKRCCPACRSICSQCQRTVDTETFDEETELCPGCLEQHQSNQQQENEHGPETNPTNLAAPAATPPSAAA